MSRRSRRPAARLVPLLLTLFLVGAACGGEDDTGAADEGSSALVGVFGIDPGVCEEDGVTEGSSFRMVQSGGSLDEGPFVGNGDSPCGDDSYTPLRPGTDGGLITGDYQPNPDPPFDEGGNAVAAQITEPQAWFAVDFALATNPVDPQTELEAPAPEITATGGELAGDLSALAAAWNGQHFNQGSPKPDGEQPGNTRPLSGTYDPDTGEYTLEWSSQIVGGPFDNFTGVWHLEGTFEPRG